MYGMNVRVEVGANRAGGLLLEMTEKGSGLKWVSDFVHS